MRWCCFTPSVSEPTKVVSKVVTTKDEAVASVKVPVEGPVKDSVKDSVDTSVDALVTVAHSNEQVQNYSPVTACNMVLLGIIVFIVYVYVLNPDTHTYIRRDRDEL
jgi:hypothetical protein